MQPLLCPYARVPATTSALPSHPQQVGQLVAGAVARADARQQLHKLVVGLQHEHESFVKHLSRHATRFAQQATACGTPEVPQSRFTQPLWTAGQSSHNPTPELAWRKTLDRKQHSCTQRAQLSASKQNLRCGAGRAGVERGAALRCAAGRWQLDWQASHTKPPCCTVQHASQQPQLPRPTCAAASLPLATGGSWWKSPDRMSCGAQGWVGGWAGGRGSMQTHPQ